MERNCEACKYYVTSEDGKTKGCSRWECQYDERMTNEEMLNKVLRNFFPRALFIREINEASHTKKIIFSDEWLIKPYRGGE